MRRTINIDGQEYEAVANAFTAILYKQIFHRDFLMEIQGFKKLKGKKTEDYTDEDLDLATSKNESFVKLAFVMCQQARNLTVPELVKLNEVDYFEWLTNFEPNVFETPSTLKNIIDLWRGNADSGVEQKNV